MGEYDKTGKAKVEYIWLGNVPVGTVIFDSAGKANLYYVETDQLYTPRVITDQNRKTVWEWKSDPFGTTLPTGTITYNQRFAGQFYDVESGLHYNYYRDYDPKMGRYVQSDPIGLNGGINTYAYVRGNPVMAVDPLGLDIWWNGSNSWTDRPEGEGWMPYRQKSTSAEPLGYPVSLGGCYETEQKIDDDCWQEALNAYPTLKNSMSLMGSAAVGMGGTTTGMQIANKSNLSGKKGKKMLNKGGKSGDYSSHTRVWGKWLDKKLNLKRVQGTMGPFHVVGRKVGRVLIGKAGGYTALFSAGITAYTMHGKALTAYIQCKERKSK